MVPQEERTVSERNVSVKSPVKKLRLAREAVKALGVRSGVRTGAVVNSFGYGNGGASLAASLGGPPKYTDPCIVLSGVDDGLP